jgi:site-specific DNA-methyltransferase (adenine-specific)
MSARVIVGDCRISMAEMETASVDSIVCDPPYELGFMGKSWDASGIAYDLEVWRQALRVLKPGGYLLAFSATRTYHRMTCAIEDAGFEIRDCIGWHYGSGFPKSLDVSKAIDKAAGVERPIIGLNPAHRPREYEWIGGAGGKTAMRPEHKTGPATDDARRWSGWGTALKPAWEPVVVARKPLEGTVAANVLKYGTGAINVDGCRVASSDALVRPPIDRNDNVAYGKGLGVGVQVEPAGRWPANVILSHNPACGEECAPGCPCAAMDAQSGGDGASRFFSNLPIEADDLVPFFYTAKPGRSERDEGCEDLEAKTSRSAMNAANGTGERRDGAPSPVRSNHHPTVKPVSVMAWCIRLVTPPGGLVLDPFTGSGTTGVAARREGMRFVGCELSEEYAEIARARIRQARGSLFAGGAA